MTTQIISTEINLESVGRLTPSETRVIEKWRAADIYKLLAVWRSKGGDLVLVIETIAVRKTKKHKPPFKYRKRAFNKWGKQVWYKAGNIFDDGDIVDDWTGSNWYD